LGFLIWLNLLLLLLLLRLVRFTRLRWDTYALLQGGGFGIVFVSGGQKLFPGPLVPDCAGQTAGSVSHSSMMCFVHFSPKAKPMLVGSLRSVHFCTQSKSVLKKKGRLRFGTTAAFRRMGLFFPRHG
jgi:hypothetical protein